MSEFVIPTPRKQLVRLRQAFGHKAFDEVVTEEERKAW